MHNCVNTFISKKKLLSFQDQPNPPSGALTWIPLEDFHPETLCAHPEFHMVSSVGSFWHRRCDHFSPWLSTRGNRLSSTAFCTFACRHRRNYNDPTMILFVAVKSHGVLRSDEWVKFDNKRALGKHGRMFLYQIVLLLTSNDSVGGWHTVEGRRQT